MQNSTKEQGNIRFLLKFYDNLSVFSRWYTSQMTLEITKIVRERLIDKTGVLCVVLDVGDLVLVQILANNRQSFVLIGHSQYLFVYSLYCGNVIESFIASYLNQVYQKLYSPQKSLYFVQVIFVLIGCMVCRGLTSEIALIAYLVCKTEICNIV